VRRIRANVAYRTGNLKSCSREPGNSSRHKDSSQSRSRLNLPSRLHGRRVHASVAEGLTSRSPVEPGKRPERTGVGLYRPDLVVGRGIRRYFRRQLFRRPRAFALVVVGCVQPLHCPDQRESVLAAIVSDVPSFQRSHRRPLIPSSIFSPLIPGTDSDRAKSLFPP
jgi:hypothetical protein